MGTEGSAPKHRNYGIDAFRLLSAIPVIAAHGGQFDRFDPLVHEVVSLLSKWSVPFFFLVLGYFLGKKTDTNRATPPMMRVAVMFVLASLLMLPLDLSEDGPSKTLHTISKTFLMSGTHFHLWFLSALIMGLLIVRVTDEYEVKWLLPVCAMTALAGAIILGSYSPPEFFHFGRHLTSIPFLWFGILLSTRSLSRRQSIALLLLGLGIQSVEAPLIHAMFGKVVSECPMLIGTVPFALGVFGIAASLRNTPLLEKLGRLGGRYTGCIYITHVYFIWIIAYVAGSLEMQNTAAYGVLVVPLIFSLNLLTLTLINRLAPIVIDVFLGDKAAVRRLAQIISSLPKTAFLTAKTIAFPKSRG